MASLPALDQIPAPLAERRQWVVWKYEARGAGEKPTKVPYQAERPSRKASSKAPHTWTTVQQALRCAAQHGFDGVGYVFAEDDPFCGFDFDDVLDAAGEMAGWAAEWLGQLATYVEVSPSGRGVKGIAVGKLPGSGINAGSVELYDQGRYFAITGQRLADAPAEPQSVNGALDRLYSFAEARKEEHERTREGQRQRAYAAAALRNEADRVQAAPEGTRNDTLNRAAFALAGYVASGLLDEGAVVDALHAAAGANGLGVAEIRGTLRSGMSAGKQAPRQVPPPRPPAEEPTPEATRSGRRVNTLTGEVLDEAGAPGTKPRPTPPASGPATWLHGTTAAELYRTQFAPLIWTVENVLPEGAALLAGKPKSRKSWAALGIAVACARGDKAFGKLTARPGEVLYLDLESNQRRMRGRLFSMIGHQMRDLHGLHIRNDWPRGIDGLDALETWMTAHPETVLIVIDVLADFRRPKDPKEDPYAYDRETVKPINEFAERHRITVLLVHHTRKMKADDVFDEISGSTGLPSAVATMWVLGRAPSGTGEMVLALRGRDLINDEPLMLEWDDYHNIFQVTGGAQDALLSAERRAILKVMADDAQWGPKDLAAELRKPVANTQQLLKALLSEGLIEKTGHGKYVRVVTRDQNDQNDQFHQNDQNDQDVDPTILIDPSPDQNQDQNCLDLSEALDDHSDHSDRDSEPSDFWRAVPPSRRTVLRLYLRSAQEKDAARAAELCEEFGLDLDEARRRAREEAM